MTQSTTIQKFIKPKRVWLAVILNMFPIVMGLGYIYLGEWGVFAALVGVQYLTEFVAIPWVLTNRPMIMLPIYIASWVDIYYRTKLRNLKASHITYIDFLER